MAGPHIPIPVPVGPTHGPVPTPRFLPAGTTNAIRTKVESEVRTLLGLSPGSSLPADLATAIDGAIDDASRQQVSKDLFRIAGKYTTEAVAARLSLDQALKSKLSVGLSGMAAVQNSLEYQEILRTNAAMLKAKYDALVTAGFTADQAFRLIEAEVYAKGTGRSPR